jgi:transmembrane sensor
MKNEEQTDPRDRDIAAGEMALQWARAHGSGARIVARSRAQRRRTWQLRGLAAGTALGLTLLAGALVWPSRPIPPTSAALSPAVVLSAPARQVLPDGSIVELREGAKIAVDFGAAVRRVRLVEGEAHFTVAENKAVPFIVVAGGIEVRAVGTAFAVQLEPRKVEVLVTEGRVAVDRPAGSSRENSLPFAPGIAPTPQTIAVVDAGRTIAVELETTVVPSALAISAAEQAQRLAWRVPRIELSGMPLSAALELFNRYSSIQLQLADPAHGAFKLSGILRPDNPNALLHVLKPW